MNTSLSASPSEYRVRRNHLKHRARSRRRGAAAVEFAVVAPLLFLMVFGMIEYGRMVMVQQLLTNASREGARVAILQSSANTDVQTAVIDKISGTIPVVTSDITITPDPVSSAVSGQTVSVAVGINFSQVSWLPSPLFLGATRLSASTSMRKELVD